MSKHCDSAIARALRVGVLAASPLAASPVRELKALGYHTVAVHPENPNNYRRRMVYRELGFDDFYARESFEGRERTAAGYVTDMADFQWVLDFLEEHPEPTFLFNVTMQNHSPFTARRAQGFDPAAPSPICEGHEDVEAFRSLAGGTDKALGYLIGQLEQWDRPVILCFFGDHQPDLDDEFVETLSGLGRAPGESDHEVRAKRYMVPYLIWSNFDMGQGERPGGPDRISPNYLGPTVLEYAGLPMSGYSRYLLSLRQQLPVVCLAGCLGADGQWRELDREEARAPWLGQYRMVQYNALFDKDKDWGPYLPENCDLAGLGPNVVK